MESPAHIFRVVPWKVFALQPAAVVNKKTISSLEGAITEPNSTQTVPKQPELDNETQTSILRQDFWQVSPLFVASQRTYWCLYLVLQRSVDDLCFLTEVVNSKTFLIGTRKDPETLFTAISHLI